MENFFCQFRENRVKLPLKFHYLSMAQTFGWGIQPAEGVEMWDARPVITKRGFLAWAKLILYPKKFALYRYMRKEFLGDKPRHTKILDVGCGTGGAIIELKKLFPRAEIAGIDVIQMQVDIARSRFIEYGVEAQVEVYDGKNIPLEDHTVDIVYTSDVLGHVADVQHWLHELNRVLKPGGRLAMFSESKLGQHAYIRNYLLRHGLNVDPHHEFHISLFSKKELQQLLSDAGFVIEKMYSTVWAKFFVHPDELYPALQSTNKFPLIKIMNALLYWIKMKTRPVSLAIAELYSFIEMYTLGRWIESQGYMILGKKK